MFGAIGLEGRTEHEKHREKVEACQLSETLFQNKKGWECSSMIEHASIQEALASIPGTAKNLKEDAQNSQVT